VVNPKFVGEAVGFPWDDSVVPYRKSPLGAHLAIQSDMFDLSPANLIGGFVFGSIGFVAFVYGKRLSLWKPMFCGIALMIYPYFIADTTLMLVIGTLGTGALFFLRD
jgi:hypothetical protein